MMIKNLTLYLVCVLSTLDLVRHSMICSKGVPTVLNLYLIVLNVKPLADFAVILSVLHLANLSSLSVPPGGGG